MSAPIPILLYHRITEDVAPRHRKWALDPRIFAAHMSYLQDHNYTPITVTQLGRAMADHAVHVPERPVVLTFDDGLADFYAAALPVLQSYAFVATLYITVGFVGATSRGIYPDPENEERMLTWPQIVALDAAGIECGAHSYTHPQLDILPPAAAREEIGHPKTVLEQHLGRPVSSFAYPHGYYSPLVRRLVQEAEYSSACAVKHAMSALTDDRFALARIIVSADTDLNSFAGLLAGRGLRVAPTRQRLRTKGWRLARRSIKLLKQTRRVQAHF